MGKIPPQTGNGSPDREELEKKGEVFKIMKVIWFFTSL